MFKKQVIYNLSIIFFIFFLDRISKIYILNFFEMKNIAEVSLNSFINIILVWNTGIGFGLFQLDQTSAYNFITFIILIINLIIVYLLFIEKRINKFFLSMILGGSLGNFYDRIVYSAVPDFIDLNYNGYHWFVFNVADIFITIGVLSLIIFEVFKRNEK
tara:strand:- start:42 stop:518 length:477 start_codon:yes stop_codon:yes gene_type:complete